MYPGFGFIVSCSLANLILEWVHCILELSLLNPGAGLIESWSWVC